MKTKKTRAPAAQQTPPDEGCGIFVHRRDLRVPDNLGLARALRECPAGVACFFVFDERQADAASNPYFSGPAFAFMCESLRELDQQLRERGGQLHVVRGRTSAEAMKRVLDAAHGSGARGMRVYFNEDETSAFSRRRDAELLGVCSAHPAVAVAQAVRGDYDLVPLEAMRAASSGKPYANLSQFHKAFLARLAEQSGPQQGLAEFGRMASLHRASPALLQPIPDGPPAPPDGLRGGRQEGLRLLARASSPAFMAAYAVDRDFPARRAAATFLSPHLKFGTVSVREVLRAVSAAGHETAGHETAGHETAGPDAFIRELAFRHFYRCLYWQERLQRGEAYNRALDAELPWRQPSDDPGAWDAWTRGRTGVPMVDAGMRQLLSTGWAHNRARMVVASFATRLLMFDWRACARFYYAHLVDADVCSNTAGWQWAAGVGVDAAPYFRRPFNPFRQAHRFDPDAEYVHLHVPETRGIPAAKLHRWNEAAVRAEYGTAEYAAPTIDVRAASDAALSTWKAAAARAKQAA